MRIPRSLIIGAAFILLGLFARAADAPPVDAVSIRDTAPDTWAGADALGRALPATPPVGSPRKDRYVAMFYFLWLDAAEKRGPFDVSKILKADPLAISRPDSPLWGPPHAMHFWGEPLFGYYLCDDPWVLRKHAQMLTDAGVDVVIFDTSNRLTYRRNYTALMEVYRQMRREGNRTPQVAFLTPFGDPRSTVRELYEQLYSKGLYKELWFGWEGKPLILADPQKVDANVRDFFTFRKPQPSYFDGPTGPDMWSWLEVYPQHMFKNARGENEQMSVGVAQNAVDGRLGSMSEAHAMGRSYHAVGENALPADLKQGANFSQQWERAIREDPKLVFVTGWNEWVAGRFSEFNGIREPVMFVDEFDEEHSRDIEPMLGGHGDNYYCQLCSCVRRYKGARPAPAIAGLRSMQLNGDFSQWNDVRPEYLDDLFDTAHRDHAGFANAGPYRDDSGRNDFDTMKVARDADNVYFYVRTRDPITAPAGDNWMVLLLSIAGDKSKNWEGYDFAINRSRPGPGLCAIERSVGGWKWESIGNGRIEWHGNEMQIAIPRNLLGMEPGKKLNFGFKWTDNATGSGDILDFYTHGDVAPNGRFQYRYSE